MNIIVQLCVQDEEDAKNLTEHLSFKYIYDDQQTQKPPGKQGCVCIQLLYEFNISSMKWAKF